MPGMKTAQRLQQQIVKDGAIVGTVAAVRAVIQDVLGDSRFHVVEAEYGPNPKPKPGKEPGVTYRVTAAKKGPTPGTMSESESAARVMENDLINLYCAGKPRNSYRSLKVPLIHAVYLYTGEKDDKGKAISVRVPVQVVNPAKVVNL